jgi:hypothetical protein
VPPREGIHVVGAAGEPGFEAGASNFPSTPGLTLPPVGFFKDHDDVVHLEGAAQVTGTPPFVFTLPTGFRPASGQIQIYETVGESTAIVVGSNVVIEGQDLSGKILASEEALLSGISFRAGS